MMNCPVVPRYNQAFGTEIFCRRMVFCHPTKGGIFVLARKPFGNMRFLLRRSGLYGRDDKKYLLNVIHN
jgi:hypothetical protein